MNRLPSRTNAWFGADRLLIGCYDTTEGEADPLADHGVRLRHCMQPVVLAGATHHQQASMTEPVRDSLLPALVLQDELALRPERQRGHDRVQSQLRLGIRMKPDGIPT